MIVQTTVLKNMMSVTEEQKREQREHQTQTFSLLAKISSRKIPTRSFLNKQIRNHTIDFRKAYRLYSAA
ncbi:MAG: hypothetical protein Q7R76_00105 [Candidatus Woesearchaeota archaeon]|nr:hypothetical protein [Candidatus Woesearchaeota archaeon]